MLREALGRRGLFKRLGVGALLAASGQENIARLSRVGVGPGALAAFPPAIPTVEKPIRIFRHATDFSSWWKEYGKEDASRQSRYCNEIDPDIAGFRLPLSTKVRMQRERNYLRIKAERKAVFLWRLLRDGEFRIYGDNPGRPDGATTAGGRSSLG